MISIGGVWQAAGGLANVERGAVEHEPTERTERDFWRKAPGGRQETARAVRKLLGRTLAEQLSEWPQRS